jgi:hypothetical protein
MNLFFWDHDGRRRSERICLKNADQVPVQPLESAEMQGEDGCERISRLTWTIICNV